MMRLFRPILAGASLRDRLIACFGAFLGIGAATLAGLGVEQALPISPYLFASIGASAVLVFAVPASPLAQPWPVFGGNIVAALSGVVAAHLTDNAYLAGMIAASLAIAAMSLLRCLHPPGGGTALIPVIGGPAIAQMGLAYPFGLVAANAAALVAAGWLFHRVSGHSYPHRAEAIPVADTLLRADIEQALEETGETFDIDPADLQALLLRAEAIAQQRKPR